MRSYSEAIELLNWGLENRIMGQTQMNATSSRSHTLLTVKVGRNCEAMQGRRGASIPLTLPPSMFRPLLLLSFGRLSKIAPGRKATAAAPFAVCFAPSWFWWTLRGRKGFAVQPASALAVGVLLRYGIAPQCCVFSLLPPSSFPLPPSSFPLPPSSSLPFSFSYSVPSIAVGIVGAIGGAGGCGCQRRGPLTPAFPPLATSLRL